MKIRRNFMLKGMLVIMGVMNEMLDWVLKLS